MVVCCKSVLSRINIPIQNVIAPAVEIRRMRTLVFVERAKGRHGIMTSHQVCIPHRRRHGVRSVRLGRRNGIADI
jgi:hypothetical protein